LPRCPQCQCPTPPGELERWSVCAVCATQRWQEH
jgi:predicted nucleic acid-binding Zn ribbon protein